MMRFPGSADRFAGSYIAIIVISNNFNLSPFILYILPHQPVAALMVFCLQALSPGCRSFATPALADAVDKKFSLRERGIYIDRNFLIISTFPIPMRKDVEGWFISVPYTSVEVETVLRDGSKVNDSKHGTMVRPCIGIIRGRFSKIVESGPDELSHGPWIVISEGKINIRDI